MLVEEKSVSELKKEIIILGSTGSIGSTVLKILKKEKSYKIKLLTAKKNISKLLKQSINFKVKNVDFNLPLVMKGIKFEIVSKNQISAIYEKNS